jgi:hypothetical protein
MENGRFWIRVYSHDFDHSLRLRHRDSRALKWSLFWDLYRLPVGHRVPTSKRVVAGTACTRINTCNKNKTFACVSCMLGIPIRSINLTANPPSTIAKCVPRPATEVANFRRLAPPSYLSSLFPKIKDHSKCVFSFLLQAGELQHKKI